MAEIEIVKPSRRSASNLLYRLAVVAAIASAGLERIDAFAGHGHFGLIPSVIFLPLALVAFLFHRWRAAGSRTSHFGLLGMTLLVLLALVTLSSILTNNPDTISIGRWVLLVIAMFGAWAAVALAVRIQDPGALRIGAYVGLSIYLILSLTQLLMAAMHGQVGPNFIGPVNVEVRPLGAEIVRLTGGSLDPNRAAIVLAFFAYLLLAEPWTAKKQRVWWEATLLVGVTALAVVTWSRSGIAAFLLIIGGTLAARSWQNGNQSKLVVAGVSFLAAAFAAMMILVLAAPRFVQYIVSTRLSISPGDSADSHLGFYQLAGQLILHEPLLLLNGLGFGQSYRVVEAVHPEMGRYGNFHSLYLTFMVETGLLGLIVILALLIIPMWRQRFWLALGALVFGIFYQDTSDSTFWFQVALLWVLPVVGIEKLRRWNPMDAWQGRRSTTATGRVPVDLDKSADAHGGTGPT